MKISRKLEKEAHEFACAWVSCLKGEFMVLEAKEQYDNAKQYFIEISEEHKK
jgi:hypothetical protein